LEIDPQARSTTDPIKIIYYKINRINEFSRKGWKTIIRIRQLPLLQCECPQCVTVSGRGGQIHMSGVLLHSHLHKFRTFHHRWIDKSPKSIKTYIMSSRVFSCVVIELKEGVVKCVETL
jgi:hypothetical protein